MADLISSILNTAIVERDKLALMADGVPLINSLIVVTQIVGGTPQYLGIEPKPYIKQLNADMVASLRGITSVDLGEQDYEVKGVSKQYSRTQLLGSTPTQRRYYIVGGTLVDGAPVGGVTCIELVSETLEETALGWNFVLKRGQPGSYR
jgi:hypothetical protein